MKLPNPFDPHPDAQLGALLRETLAAPDPDGFVRRVLAAVRGAPEESSLEVLARWAWPGVAAAAALALVFGLLLGRTDDAGPAALASAEAPSAEIVFASIVGEER